MIDVIKATVGCFLCSTLTNKLIDAFAPNTSEADAAWIVILSGVCFGFLILSILESKES